MRAELPNVRSPSIAPTDQTVSDFAISGQRRILAEARLYWSRNWAKRLSQITGKNPRTCYRWYAKRGRREPTAGDIIAIVAAMRAEWTQRGRIFEQFEFDLDRRVDQSRPADRSS